MTSNEQQQRPESGEGANDAGEKRKAKGRARSSASAAAKIVTDPDAVPKTRRSLPRKKRKKAPLRIRFSKDTRTAVENYAGLGLPYEQIAQLVINPKTKKPIDCKTLRRHFDEEMQRGNAKTSAKVAESMYRKAIGNGPQCVTAGIWWTKTRMGWREPRSEVEVNVENAAALAQRIHEAMKSMRSAVPFVSPASANAAASSAAQPDASKVNGHANGSPATNGHANGSVNGSRH